MGTDLHGKLLYEELTYKIRGIFFATRKEYGPGQKESIYHNILLEKFEKSGLKAEHEKRIPLQSHDTGKLLGLYQPDFVVQDKIIIEVKSTALSSLRDEKQLYHYIRNSIYEVGFLVNFSTPKLFIKRIIYTNDRKPHLNSV